MDAPEITTAHILNLLASSYDDAVLYVNNEDGEPTLEIWTEAYVPHHQVVLNKVDTRDVLDPLGEDTLTADDIEHMLPGYQDEVDNIVDGLYDEADQVARTP